MNGARRVARFGVAALGCFAVVAAITSLAAANTVPASGAGLTATPVAVDFLIPPECRFFKLDNVISGSGVIAGTIQSDLILGGPGADTISGFNQKDCILGGGGNDTLLGGNAEDVLVGGAGDDRLNGGNGMDICYGGPGADTFSNCETIFP